jgi:hypothetical protein
MPSGRCEIVSLITDPMTKFLVRQSPLSKGLWLKRNAIIRLASNVEESRNKVQLHRESEGFLLPVIHFVTPLTAQHPRFSSEPSSKSRVNVPSIGTLG